jgi:hypothetical protein
VRSRAQFLSVVPSRAPPLRAWIHANVNKADKTLQQDQEPIRRRIAELRTGMNDDENREAQAHGRSAPQLSDQRSTPRLAQLFTHDITRLFVSLSLLSIAPERFTTSHMQGSTRSFF